MMSVLTLFLLRGVAYRTFRRSYGRRLPRGKVQHLNEDVDIRSYIKEVAPKSGQNAKVWQRVADALTRFGVRTMAELEKTGDGALYRLF